MAGKEGRYLCKFLMTRTRRENFFILQKAHSCLEKSGEFKQNIEKTYKTDLRKHLSVLQSYCNLYFLFPNSYEPWQKLRQYQDFFPPKLGSPSNTLGTSNVSGNFVKKCLLEIRCKALLCRKYSIEFFS